MGDDTSAVGPVKEINVSIGAKRNILRKMRQNIYAEYSDTKHPPQGVKGGGLVCWSEAKIKRRGGRHYRKTQGSRGDNK